MTLLEEKESASQPYPDGSLLRFHASKQIYLIEKGSKRLIVSGQVFANHGFDFGDVIVLNDAEVLNDYMSGPDMTA